MTSFLTRTIAEAERIAAEPWRAPDADGASAWTDVGRRPRPEELEAIRQAAREQGHREGLEAGRAEGLAAGRDEAEAQARRLERVVVAAARPLEALDADVLDDLVRLVLRATAHVVRREATIDAGVVRTALELALEQLPAVDREVTVRVHPEDVAAVSEAIARSTVAQRAHVVAAEELARGGVELIAGASRIDASVEARLEEVFSRVIDAA